MSRDSLPGIAATVTSPAALRPASPLIPEAEPPADSHSDFIPTADCFALELRAESIEQLCGGDALRRGENERIEAGRSDGSSDLVAGCDRVQVQDTLAEHTGGGLAMQAAHLETTVDGSSETWAGQEDTAFLAGHMHDTWNGGTAIVAAMSDDLAAGGGLRATAPLDLWLHGLMGLEERPGTCTADGVLAEACGTLYEREYRSAVHAAGLAVFNGALYQSVRNSFRPLMRVSTGVRNLIAGGGGGSGGDTPPASPPPAAGGAGADGAEGAGAASETLAAGRGAAQTPQDGREAARLDVTEVLAPEAGEGGIVAVSDDPSELRHGADTAERLDGLRDGLRGSGAGDETASGAWASEAAAAAFGYHPVDPPGYLDGRPAAVALDPEPPSLQPGGRQVQRPTPKLGLLGGADEPIRRKPVGFDWRTAYDNLGGQHAKYSASIHRRISLVHSEAIYTINKKVMDVYVDIGGSVDDLADRPRDNSKAERAYDILGSMAFDAERTGNVDRAAEIGRAVETIDQLTYDVSARLAARAAEFENTYNAATMHIRIDPHIDEAKLADWVDSQMDGARRDFLRLSRDDPRAATQAVSQEYKYFRGLRREIADRRNPVIYSRAEMRYLTEIGQTATVEDIAELHVRLLEAMADPRMHRSAAAIGDATYARAHVRRRDLAQLPLFDDSDRFVHVHGAAGTSPVLRSSDPFASVTVSADIDGFAHAIFDRFDLGPGGRTRAGATAGGTAPHAGAVEVIAIPQLGNETVAWSSPTGTVRSWGPVQFDIGLQRAGRQPEAAPPGLGETPAWGTDGAGARLVPEPAAVTRGPEAVDTPRFGAPGEAFPQPRIGAATVAPDSGSPGTAPPWVEDDFAVERALNAGRLPPDFDTTGLIREWGWLAQDTPLEGQLESGLLPIGTIDSMIDGYKAVEEGRRHALLIGHLRAMKDSIIRALADAYPNRTHPEWLARVDEAPQARRADQAADGDSVPVTR